MVTLIIRSEKGDQDCKGSKENIGGQVAAALTPDAATGFPLAMSSGGRNHPNASLSPYVSLGLNSSHNTPHGADTLYLITEDNQGSKPQSLLKEWLFSVAVNDLDSIFFFYCQKNKHPSDGIQWSSRAWGRYLQ